jgi:hypothetical protein
VSPQERNVSFTCDGTSVLAKLRWCYDLNCTEKISPCSSDFPNNFSDACYKNGSDYTTLHFKRISENNSNKKYYCRQFEPPVSSSSQTVKLKLLKPGKPSLYIEHENTQCNRRHRDGHTTEEIKDRHMLPYIIYYFI